jgi:hypothetical protein
MSAGIPFQAFLLRHQYTPERAFVNEFPLGCLLDSANPTASSQRGAFIYPLCKREAALAVTGSTIMITSQGGEDVVEQALRSRVIVGRDPARCDVALTGEAIAPVHAYFFMRRGRLHIADCGGAAGTVVAGQQLRPGTRVPLRPDSITEVWFGEEGYFHFDARSLYSYVHYLLGTHEAKPQLRAETGRAPASDLATVEPPAPTDALVEPVAAPAPSGAAPAMGPGDDEAPTETHARPELPAPAGEPPEAWRCGLAALRQLAASLQAVSVVVERNDEPVRLYDADARQDLEVALRALDGMRPVVTHVQAHLRRSRFKLTVFQR